MSEQKRGYMTELDRWMESNVIKPLSAVGTRPYAEIVAEVKALIRAKVLQSYRNGQAAGPTRRSFQQQRQK